MFFHRTTDVLSLSRIKEEVSIQHTSRLAGLLHNFKLTTIFSYPATFSQLSEITRNPSELCVRFWRRDDEHKSDLIRRYTVILKGEEQTFPWMSGLQVQMWAFSTSISTHISLFTGSETNGRKTKGINISTKDTLTGVGFDKISYHPDYTADVRIS